MNAFSSSISLYETEATKTKTYKILDGFRGGPVYDTPAISDCLKRLSQFVTDFDDIKELDINPLIVYEKGKGCKIVDARIILKTIMVVVSRKGR